MSKHKGDELKMLIVQQVLKRNTIYIVLNNLISIKTPSKDGYNAFNKQVLPKRGTQLAND